MILEWKPRWCVLSADGSTLCYYEPWCPWTGGQLQLVNTVPLATAEITRHEYKGKRFCFYVNAPRTLQVISAHTHNRCMRLVFQSQFDSRRPQTDALTISSAPKATKRPTLGIIRV